MSPSLSQNTQVSPPRWRRRRSREIHALAIHEIPVPRWRREKSPLLWPQATWAITARPGPHYPREIRRKREIAAAAKEPVGTKTERLSLKGLKDDNTITRFDGLNRTATSRGPCPVGGDQPIFGWPGQSCGKGKGPKPKIRPR